MEKHHAVASTRSETRNVQTSLPHQNILARRLLGGGIDAHIAHADDAKHKIAEFLDLDGDKRISYEEFVHSMAVQAIRDMDSDKDGHLSAAEAKQSAAPENTSIPALDFHAIDLNGDGKISLDELKQALGANADVEAIFRRLDIDGDGFLSEAELQGSHGTPQIRFRF